MPRKRITTAPTSSQSTVGAFQSFADSLNSIMFEREDVVEGSMFALLAKTHLFMIGPPGTGKSMISRKMCRGTKGAEYFELLMDKFTKPEELFGPYKLTELKKDAYERNTACRLPEAHIVFLDEIWKANGAILNTLLTVMDESRTFYNGGTAHQSPMISLFGASNELPESGELDALWDRFVLRYVVSDITDDSNFKKMLQSMNSALEANLTMGQITTAQAQVEQVQVPGSVIDALAELRGVMRGEGFQFQGRRWKQALSVLKARAWLHGRDQVSTEDFEVLANVFWNVPADRKKIMQVIVSFVNPEMSRALELLDAGTEVYQTAITAKDTAQGMEANDKLNMILDDLKGLSQTEKVREITAQIKQLKRDIAREVLKFD